MVPTLKEICSPTSDVRLASREPTASKAQRSMAARRWTSRVCVPSSAREFVVIAATLSSEIDAV